MKLYLTQTAADDDSEAGVAVSVQDIWPPAQRPAARRVIFNIFILLYMLRPPLAAFTAMPTSWLAQFVNHIPITEHRAAPGVD